MTRVGVVGIGRWGTRILETLKKFSDVEILWATGSNSDWRTQLYTSRPDGVVIATPASTHFDMAREAIRGRFPVFVEKPLAMNLEDARELLELSRAMDTLLVVDHVYLWHPALIEMRRQLSLCEGVQSIMTTGGNRGPVRTDCSVLYDYGPHDIAIACALLGRPSHVSLDSCMGIWDEKKHAIVPGHENYMISMKWPKATAALHFGNAFDEKVRRVVVTTKEDVRFVFDDLSAMPLRRGESPVVVSAEPPLAAALRSFIDAIKLTPKGLTPGAYMEQLDIALDVAWSIDQIEKHVARGYVEA